MSWLHLGTFNFRLAEAAGKRPDLFRTFFHTDGPGRSGLFGWRSLAILIERRLPSPADCAVRRTCTQSGNRRRAPFRYRGEPESNPCPVLGL
jgi:hypothetical protein